MHVLYLHQHFVSPEQPGGTRSYEMARRLVARGHRVTLLGTIARSRGRGPGVEHRVLEGIELRLAAVPYDNAMGPRARMAAFGRYAAWASAQLMRHRPDVILASSTPLTVALPGLWGRLWHRVPMVFEVRDLWPELPLAIGALRSPVSRTLARGLAWAAYRGAAEVIALSPGMADGVAAWGVPRSRITVIPNGCDREAFAVEPERVAAERWRHFPGLEPEQPLVLYAGTLGWMNDVGWLVELAGAVASIDPRIRFAIVGDGAQREAIAARARARGVLERVLWMHPSVPKRQMPGVLAAATVATSLFRPVPAMVHNSANKLFDALAAGRPVAINYGGWQARMLRESGAGLAVPHAVEPAADALVSLLHDRPRLVAAGEAARRLATERFDRDQQAERLEGVLHRAVERGPRSV